MAADGYRFADFEAYADACSERDRLAGAGLQPTLRPIQVLRPEA
jgi:hypothetical protein